MFAIDFHGLLIELEGKVQYVGLFDYEEFSRTISFKDLQSLVLRKYNNKQWDIIYCIHPKDELPCGLHVVASKDDLKVMLNRLDGEKKLCVAVVFC